MAYGQGPTMTVAQLLEKLQTAVADHPELADVVPDIEGCDCGDELGGVDINQYHDGSWHLDLRRSDSVERDARRDQ